VNENGQEAAQAAKACLPCLIEAMNQPGFFPDRPASVELRQTHISYVLLAGEYAYKIKKPVRFPFLSCGTLAERYRLCQEEIRLNRRLAPDIYLGVFPIMAAADGFALGPQSRTFDPCAFEYVVKMRRLPEDRMLDRLVAKKAVGKEVIRALADKLAGFHREAPAARSWTCGSAASIWRTVVGDLEQNERFVGNTIEAGALAAIEEHCRGFVMSHWELLNDRARERRVRECHGDLRCGSVCLTEPVTIYDCLEFNEHLRYCDVASEIAFLAMDFDRLGAPGLADRETIAKLVQALKAPLNILALPACPPVAELEKIGVARVSSGSWIMRAAMGVVQRVGKEMLEARTYETMFAGAMPYIDLKRMMTRQANEANA
jgi:aminoglycoside phosphotransferase family enzyme